MFTVKSINRNGRPETRGYAWIGDARAMAKYLRNSAGHQYVELWDEVEQTSIDIDGEGGNYA